MINVNYLCFRSMKRKPCIQLKATILVIVFLLNTVLGFACSVGLDGNSLHSHSDDLSHHHASSINHHNSTIDHHYSNEEDDNCCKDDVEKFEKTGKLVPQFSDFSPLVFSVFLSEFFYFDASTSYITLPINQFQLRKHHPPIPDIRMVRQSFQI